MRYTPPDASLQGIGNEAAGSVVLSYYARPRKVRTRHRNPRTDHDIERLRGLLRITATAIPLLAGLLAYGGSGLVSSKAFRTFWDAPKPEPVRYIMVPVGR